MFEEIVIPLTTDQPWKTAEVTEVIFVDEYTPNGEVYRSYFIGKATW